MLAFLRLVSYDLPRERWSGGLHVTMVSVFDISGLHTALNIFLLYSGMLLVRP